MKSTAMSGMKQFLKPDAYKQSELRMTEISDQKRRNAVSAILIAAICLLK